MGETSRREFLKSSAAAAVVIGGSSFVAEESLSANSPKSRAIKKGLVYDMLPQTLSHRERCRLAREVGFEVVQAPTTADEHTADEMKAAAEKAGIRIDSVMNMDHWDFPLSSSDPATVEKSLSGMRTSLHNAKLWGSDVVLLVPGVVNTQTSYRDAWTQRSLIVVPGIAEVGPTGRAVSVRK